MSPALPLEHARVFFIDYLRRHPEVEGNAELLDGLSGQFNGLDDLNDIPDEAVPPIGRSIRKALGKSDALFARAWRAYQDITDPVFERWKEEGTEPPDVPAVSYKAGPRVALLGKNLDTILAQLQGEGCDQLRLAAALRGAKVVDALLTEEMGRSLVGLTRGATGDAEIAARKRSFLGLEWDSEAGINLEVLRNLEAHGHVVVDGGVATAYDEDARTVVAALTLTQVRRIIDAARAACEVVSLDAAITAALDSPSAETTRRSPPG